MPNKRDIRYIDPDPKNKRRILYTNPKGARYEQGGELFTCGGVHVDDVHLLPKPAPVVEKNTSNESAATVAAAAAILALKTVGNPGPDNDQAPDKNQVSESTEPKGPGKLNMELAREVRNRSESGATEEALAASYGVSTQSIKNILENVTYQEKSPE